MSRPHLILKPGKEKSLQRRHPWLFSGAVGKTIGDPSEGDLVDVCAADGSWMATGHYQSAGSIVCKILSFDTPDISTAWLEQRIASAIRYRHSVGIIGQPSTNVYRLIHAEGDNLPGLVCDWYNGILVLQAHSVGMHRLFPQIADVCQRLLRNDGLTAIFDKSSSTLPSPCSDGYICGNGPAEQEIMENGIRMMVNLYEGQKTGFFIDQRENRALVSDLSTGRRVLNCFGYTGGFSLAALKGGASYVETVDISRKAIALCDKNVEFNFGTTDKHTGVVADVLQYLSTDASANRFDLVILDPPAFAKNHRSLQQGLKGYRTINQKAIEQMPSGGLLLTFSCSQAVSTDDFRTMVFTSAALAGRSIRVARQLPHALDHPVSIYHPEGEYLKGLLLEVE